MTLERDADRLTRAWLELGPDHAPDRTIAAVLQAIETTPQVRRPWRWSSWRDIRMNRMPVVATVAATLVVVAGGVLLLNRPPDPSIGTPTAGPSAAPSASPSIDPPVPDAIKGAWVASSRGTALEEANNKDVTTILLGDEGTNDLPADFQLDRRGCCTPILGSSITVVEPDLLRFTIDQTIARCEHGATGDYRYAVTPDRQWLTLELVADECATRSDVLAGTWQHSLAHGSLGGPGIAAVFEPYLAFTLPAKGWVGRGLWELDTVVVDSGDATFKVWKNIDGFADPCDITKGRLTLEGMDAVLAYLNDDPRFTVTRQDEFTIDGHRAVEVAFRIGDNLEPPCWTFDGNANDRTGVLTWMPRAEAEGFWNAPIASDGLLVVTEVDGATLTFEAVAGSELRADRATLESIRFLDSMPEPPAN